MNEEQTKRSTDHVATVLIAATREYSEARARALATNLCACHSGATRTHTWLDLNNAASETGHAFASYVAFGYEPVALLRVAGHGLGARAIVWFERVSEDIAARLRGEPGVIPSTDDLPAPPVTRAL